MLYQEQLTELLNLLLDISPDKFEPSVCDFFNLNLPEIHVTINADSDGNSIYTKCGDEQASFCSCWMPSCQSNKMSGENKRLLDLLVAKLKEFHREAIDKLNQELKQEKENRKKPDPEKVLTAAIAAIKQSAE